MTRPTQTANYREESQIKRKHDRHSPEWRELHRKHQFVGIDGEGENTPDGDHIYTLLCNSRGQSISNNSGLDFSRCADFLIATAKENPTANIVGYSINYDVQMMIKKLPKPVILELWEKHATRYRQYYIEWIPSKFMRIVRGKKTTGHKRNENSVTVWDTFGFFQQSFYASILEWQVCSKETADEILGMKQQRGNFENVDKQSIETYCFKECGLLESLMLKLAVAFRTADIPLRRYDGAGAAAAGLMSKHHILDHLEREPEIESLALRAYFGGRVELFRIGEYAKVHNIDINSAYPYALTKLPSLTGGRWYHGNYAPKIPFAIWYVEWNLNGNEPLSPFPHRDKSGRIHYVRRGSGWYHSVEVEAARLLYGDAVISSHGYVFEPSSNERPFAFLEKLYEERRRRKASGDVSQLPMKLAMNGISGKLAQGRGYNGAVPRYQNFYWAGLVTATTRAQILTAAYPIRSSLVGIATDGVFSLQPNETLRYGTALGDFESGIYIDYLSAQPGVYCAWKPSGETDETYDCRFVGRNRGFTTREINWPDLRQSYRRNGIGCRTTYTPTRFVSVGASLPQLKNFATWQQRERKLSITYGMKWPNEDAFIDRTHPEYGVLYPGLPDQYESQPYQPKGEGWLDFAELEAFLEQLEEW